MRLGWRLPQAKSDHCNYCRMSFYVGQKVVCVDDQHFLVPNPGRGPIKGCTYQIREVTHVGSILAIGLVGVGEHGYYRAFRFRPADEPAIEANAHRKELFI
jgi:hypothetical protein